MYLENDEILFIKRYGILFLFCMSFVNRVKPMTNLRKCKYQSVKMWKKKPIPCVVV